MLLGSVVIVSGKLIIVAKEWLMLLVIPGTVVLVVGGWEGEGGVYVHEVVVIVVEELGTWRSLGL